MLLTYIADRIAMPFNHKPIANSLRSLMSIIMLLMLCCCCWNMRYLFWLTVANRGRYCLPCARDWKQALNGTKDSFVDWPLMKYGRRGVAWTVIVNKGIPEGFMYGFIPQKSPRIVPQGDRTATATCFQPGTYIIRVKFIPPPKQNRNPILGPSLQQTLQCLTS